MHGELVVHGKPVVHQRKNTLLVFASVPSSKDDRLLLLNVEHNCNVRVQVVSFPVLIDLRAGIDDREVGLKVLELLLGLGADEHVGHKVLRPGHLVNEANLTLRLGRGTDEAVEDIALLLGIEVGDGLVVQLLEDLGSGGLVDVVPVDMLGGIGTLVEDEPLVLGRAAGELARIDGECIAILGRGDPTLVVGDLVLEEFLICQVFVDGRWAGNAELVDAGFGTGGGTDESFGYVVLIAFRRLGLMSDGTLVGNLMSLIEPCFVNGVDVALERESSFEGQKGNRSKLDANVQEKGTRTPILDSHSRSRK